MNIQANNNITTTKCNLILYHNKPMRNILRRQNFRRVQTETNCRQHFKVHLKWKIHVVQYREENNVRKGEIACYFTSNFFISQNVFHSYISLVHQNAVLRVILLIHLQKVSTLGSLRSPYSLTWVETFYYRVFFFPSN